MKVKNAKSTSEKQILRRITSFEPQTTFKMNPTAIRQFTLTSDIVVVFAYIKTKPQFVSVILKYSLCLQAKAKIAIIGLGLSLIKKDKL
jgi:hypothetical protein